MLRPPWTGRIRLSTALITGVPLGLLMARGENHTRDTWLLPLLLAPVWIGLLGLPQGYLVMRPIWQSRWWRAGLLLPTMVAMGLVLLVSAVLVSRSVSERAPGGWVRVPDPPVRATALVGPTCYRRYPFTITIYAETTDHSILRFDDNRWTVIDAPPVNDNDGRCERFERARSATSSSIEIHQMTVDCFDTLEVSLEADGRIWRRERGSCAIEDVAWLVVYLVASATTSVIAWLVIVVSAWRQRRTVASGV
jgi:hypothetical protein